MYNLTPAEQISLFGYCLIEDVIPAEIADQLAQRCIQLHEELKGQPNLEANNGYETLFGVMNYEDDSWNCVIHPQVLDVIQTFLGPEAQVEECCSKLAKPGCPAGGVHTDSAQDFPQTLPDSTWMINSFWMLSDFTVDNGSTVVAPCSHLTRKRPPNGIKPSDKHMVPVTGKRGSVFMWHGGLWHANSANVTQDHIRAALNIAYYPIWWNPHRDGQHQFIKKENYDRMPAQLQNMLRERHEKLGGR